MMQKFLVSRTRKLTFISFVFVVFLPVFFVILNSSTASAAYNPERLIDNGVFLDSSSMSLQDIQSFLVSRGSGLASRNFVLNCYGPTSQERQLYTSIGAPCDQATSASSIIYYASQIYGINPRVVLATLQKEQSLISAANPSDWQMNQAMGYGCPTTGNCAGSSTFSYQIDSGVWVLRYHYERANSNLNWWSPSSSWTCGTAKSLYSTGLYPGNTVTFKDTDGVAYKTIKIANAATSSFYCYTPHAYNNHRNGAANSDYPTGTLCYPYSPHYEYGETGRCYTGSFNFVYWYERWFGTTQIPGVFKIEGSSTVYIAINGYRVALPAMYTLQDYGYNPESIAVIKQSTGNLLPVPPISSGISSTLGHIIKSTSDTDSDGGSVYFVSVGVAYPLKDMTQFVKYGFDQQSITYVPLNFVQNMKIGQILKDFIKTPDGSVFSINSRQKHVIFNNLTHLSANPGGVVSLVSSGTASLLASGNPYSDGDAVFLKKSNSAAVFAYNNNSYYAVSADSYSCWGVNVLSDRPLRSLQPEFLPESISSSTQLDCIYKDALGIPQLLTGQRMKNLSLFTFGNNSQPPPADLINLFNNTAKGSPLGRIVKSNDSEAVWYLEGGFRRAIPSMSNFSLLDGANQLEVISTGSVNAISQSTIKLGDGQAVKSPDNSSVFVINDNKRYVVPTPELFNSLRLSWNNIETYPKNILDSIYPISSDSIRPYLYDVKNNKTYLLDINGCYYLPAAVIPEYVQTPITNQAYGTSIAPYINLNSCITATQFVKSSESDTVYRLELGLRRPVSSWDRLLELNGGIVPYISKLSTNIINSFSIGSNY